MKVFSVVALMLALAASASFGAVNDKNRPISVNRPVASQHSALEDFFAGLFSSEKPRAIMGDAVTVQAHRVNDKNRPL